MNDVTVERIVDEAFSEAGFQVCKIDTTGSALFRIYRGNGMVWGASVVPSFEAFERWWKSPQDEARVVSLLARASTVEEKWNLTVLVFVLEPITESVLPMISEFQENPTAFGRFVLASGADMPTSDLKQRIGFLLLRWLTAPSGTYQEGISIEDDIGGIVNDVAADGGNPPLTSTATALVQSNIDPQNVVAALQADIERNRNHEAR